MATKTRTEPTILDRIRDHLERFLYLEDADISMILALWIMHTYTFSDSFPRSPWVTPYLYVFSEVPGAGKTTTIRVIRPLVFNPESAGDMTSAAMYSLIEQDRPTLLVDEIDTVFRGSGEGNQALRRTLNTGYEHSGNAIRKQGKEVMKFSTFCAKLLAGIKDLHAEIPETVQTRSIPLKLTKGHPKETYYSFMVGPEQEEIVEEISAWIRANGERIADYMPKPIGGFQDIDPRAFEISFPLLQLAHALGVESEVRATLVRLLAPPERKEKPEIVMLRKIREHFDETGQTKEYSRVLAELFGWTTKHLSKMLEPFGITGSNTMSLPGQKPAKGYWKSQFEDAWSRYL